MRGSFGSCGRFAGFPVEFDMVSPAVALNAAIGHDGYFSVGKYAKSPASRATSLEPARQKPLNLPGSFDFGNRARRFALIANNAAAGHGECKLISAYKLR
jgi:hypothetical protein